MPDICSRRLQKQYVWCLAGRLFSMNSPTWASQNQKGFLILLPKLLAAMTSASDKSMLVPYFKAVVEIDQEYAVEMVSPNFHEKPPSFRKVAISAFGMARIKSAFPLFLQSLADENEIVKNAAIYAIGNFESPQAIERLINLQDDPSKATLRGVKNS